MTMKTDFHKLANKICKISICINIYTLKYPNPTKVYHLVLEGPQLVKRESPKDSGFVSSD